MRSINRQQLKLSSAKGFGLLSVVMIIAVIIIIIQAGFTLLTRSKQYNRQFLQTTELSALRKYIDKKIDCTSFEKAASGCKIGKTVEIPSIEPNKMLISQDPEKTENNIGGFILQARCESCSTCQRKRTIEISYIVSDNSNYVDRIKRGLTGADFAPLYTGGSKVKCSK